MHCHSLWHTLYTYLEVSTFHIFLPVATASPSHLSIYDCFLLFKTYLVLAQGVKMDHDIREGGIHFSFCMCVHLYLHGKGSISKESFTENLLMFGQFGCICDC